MSHPPLGQTANFQATPALPLGEQLAQSIKTLGDVVRLIPEAYFQRGPEFPSRVGPLLKEGLTVRNLPEDIVVIGSASPHVARVLVGVTGANAKISIVTEKPEVMSGFVQKDPAVTWIDANTNWEAEMLRTGRKASMIVAAQAHAAEDLGFLAEHALAPGGLVVTLAHEHARIGNDPARAGLLVDFQKALSDYFTHNGLFVPPAHARVLQGVNSYQKMSLKDVPGTDVELASGALTQDVEWNLDDARTFMKLWTASVRAWIIKAGPQGDNVSLDDRLKALQAHKGLIVGSFDNVLAGLWPDASGGQVPVKFPVVFKAKETPRV